MPQVSRRKLPPKAWESVWSQLLLALEKTSSKADYQVFLDGLLTKTEKVMLSKRLMVGVLHLNGWEVSTIAQYLNMSTSTVYRMATLVTLNQPYQALLKKLFPRPLLYSSKVTVSSFWDFIFSEMLISKSEHHRRLRKSFESR